jgi:hypothetical protein
MLIADSPPAGTRLVSAPKVLTTGFAESIDINLDEYIEEARCECGKLGSGFVEDGERKLVRRATAVNTGAQRKAEGESAAWREALDELVEKAIVRQGDSRREVPLAPPLRVGLPAGPPPLNRKSFRLAVLLLSPVPLSKRIARGHGAGNRGWSLFT